MITAVLDASVLYPAPLRDFLMRLSLFDCFNPKWTIRIHKEWVTAVARDRPDLTIAQFIRTRHLMDAHAPSALVTDFEDLIGTVELPDPDDRHVFAAAIRSNATVIVTMNLRHFPASALRPLGKRAQHPDEFVMDLVEEKPDSVVAAANEQCAALKSPSQTFDQFLDTLSKQGLKRVVRFLRTQSGPA